MTTKAQKAALRKQRHDRQVAQRLEKKRALVAQSESPDDEEELIDPEDTDTTEVDVADSDSVFDEEAGDDVVEDPEEPEEVKKDYGDGMGMDVPAPMGPTSWDELDFARAAQEQSHELRMTSYDVEDLVRNILNHPVMDAGDKATAIQAVGEGFQGRVDDILSGNSPEDMQKDLDLLTLEAIISYDRRHTPVTERMGDWISKAKLSYQAKKNKADSAYALVTTRGKVKVRKYLIHDKAHVRNALARAAQQIKRGGQGAADARAALPKIHAAAKRMGIGMGKSTDDNAIVIEKDAKGNWRWVGWSTNNFKDAHNDIISKEAHQEYVKFLDEHPDMAPIFMSWHTPGTERAHPVDYWNFENGFMLMSGILEPAEAAGLLKAKGETDLGMSFQGFGLRQSEDPRVVTKYRMFEVSDLPLENAANPFTAFAVLTKEQEDDMDKKKYLATILGSEAKAEAYLQKAGLAQAELQKAGVEQKSTDGTPKAEPKPEDKSVKAAQTLTTIAAKAPEGSEAIIKAVMDQLDVEGLNEFLANAKEAMDKVPVLEGLIKSMQTNQDEQLAEKITPPAARFVWARKERASASDSTKVEKDDKLVQSVPGLGENWLSQVTHTTPIEDMSVKE